MPESPQEEDLQARWERLWAWGEDLDERQARLLASMEEISPEMFDRALAVLHQEREQYHAELQQLKAELARREEEQDDGPTG